MEDHRRLGTGLHFRASLNSATRDGHTIQYVGNATIPNPARSVLAHQEAETEATETAKESCPRCWNQGSRYLFTFIDLLDDALHESRGLIARFLGELTGCEHIPVIRLPVRPLRLFLR